MDNKVSIIVPIYNVESFIRQCLDSLIHQTYQNLEIILIDDGSPDNCGVICDEYAEMDSRITVIHKKNAGVGAARNDGIACATGEWICFVDGDDWASADMISSLLAYVNAQDVVIGDTYVAWDNKLIKTSFFSPDISETQKKNPLYLIGNALGCAYYGVGRYCNIGVPWARLYRRQFLLNNHIEFPVGVRRMQDLIFNINVFVKTQRISFCCCPIYYYRVTGESACRRYDPHYEEVIRQVLLGIRGLLKNNSDPEIQKLYDFKVIWLMLENISIYYCHPQCTLSYKEKIDGLKSIFTDPDNMSALNACDKKLFNRKQHIVLWFIHKHMCAVVYQMYRMKNIKRKHLYINEKNK